MAVGGVAAFLHLVFRIVAVVLGLGLVFAGIALLIALLSVLFFGSISLIAPFSYILYPLADMLNAVLTSQWQVLLASAGILLSVGIPLILIMLAGLQLIFNFDNNSRIAGAIFLTLWILGIVLLFIAGIQGLIVYAAS